MGGPRKNKAPIEGEDKGKDPMEGINFGDVALAVAELPELKACPACGGKAEVKKDIHDLWRGFCQTCGFWDCGAHEEPVKAAESWNAAGGPNPVE
jgi:hypothetical protein